MKSANQSARRAALRQRDRLAARAGRGRQRRGRSPEAAADARRGAPARVDHRRRRQARCRSATRASSAASACSPSRRPTVEQAIEILRGIASKYEAHHHVQIGEGAIVAAVRLAKRYLQDRALPDAAIDLLDETASRKRVEIDGVPAKVDEAIRRLASLKAQVTSLAGDVDAMSVKTRERIEKEIARSRADGERDAREARLAPRRRGGLRGAPGGARPARGEMRRGARQARLRAARGARARAAAGREAAARGRRGRGRARGAAATSRTSSPRKTSRASSATGPASPSARCSRPRATSSSRWRRAWPSASSGRTRPCARSRGRCAAGASVCAIRASPSGRSSSSGRAASARPSSRRRSREFLFDDEQSLTRLDMSEFMEKHMARGSSARRRATSTAKRAAS